MFSTFSTALSALSADTTAISVVGNNLANLNTPGFKDSTVSFYDMVTQSMGTGLGETQVGCGVGPPITIQQFTQGTIQPTGSPLDAAIQGDGFFVVQDSSGGTLYTRGGSFEVDQSGNLTTATGEMVQGWTSTDGVLNTNGPLGTITIPPGTLTPPKATGTMSVNLNLDAAGATGDQFSTPVTIYDSLGTSHVVTVTFTKDATAGQWDYTATIPGADVGDATDASKQLATGSVTFDSNGNLATPTAGDGPISFDITGFADGASDITGLHWQLYNGTSPQLTQFAQPSAVAASTQDGSAAGQLTSVGILNGGQVVAQYSTGQQVVVGQMALASILNPESLVAVGDNDYQLGAASATPAIGVAATGGRGQVTGSAVEASTVDIATEFTNLIILQRSYEANSKVVTTTDQLSQDTINLKT